MKKSLKLFSVLLALPAFLFIACEKLQNIPEPTLEVADNSNVVNLLVSSTVGPDSIGCYYFVFPMDLVEADGSIQTVNSFVEAAWSNVVDFVYPIELQHVANGTSITINSIEEAETKAADCDDNLVGGGSGDNLQVQLFEVVQNSDSIGCYFFKYPLDIITLSDNQVHTVNSIQDIVNLSSITSSGWDYVYPFKLIKMITEEEVIIHEVGDISDALDDCD